MNQFFLYLLKVATALAFFYIVYHFFLSRDTMYSRNRFFILLSLVSSLILPLITIKTRQPLDIQFFGKDLTGVVITGTAENDESWRAILSSAGIMKIIFIIYLSGVILLSVKLMVEMSHLLLIVSRKKVNGNKVIRLSGNKVSGFTAFGHIFIDEVLSAGDEEEIIKHEQKHLDRKHFFDIVFIELVKILQWFNPVVYMFDRSLRAVHEYQADDECLSSGIPVISYQGLMLNQVFKTRVFSATSRFSNPTLIKKRMIMMTKKRSKAPANLKMLLVLPFVALLLIIFSTCAKKSFDNFAGSDTPPPSGTDMVAVENSKLSAVKEGDAFVVVEEMPMFPGGDLALLKHIAENTKYPAEAKEKNIQGRVIVRFKIMDDGAVQDVSVIKGVDPVLDAEAQRVVSELPSFQPGKQGGVAVPVWYMVPITFTLSDKSTAVPPPPPPPPADVSKGSGGSFSSDPKEPFVVVEEMPMFPGGDAALLQYLAGNINYPEAAKVNGITGRVILRFCVTENGTVDRISVLKSVDPLLDAEAFRVVSTLPAFKPGKQGGVAVPVWYMVPVTFALDKPKVEAVQAPPA
ncbi:MAG TPA: M56 family metallopeptidase [Bacteroidales bacterium]|nr:M56 family metallopeptidase [Bacteroidales bacterium]HOX75688.1 M56 family metallopeptidase [Bacteroidales bacterium]HQM69539.1 M56 family metallopeptidase [Bacteroidales bacterium]